MTSLSSSSRRCGLSLFVVRLSVPSARRMIDGIVDNGAAVVFVVVVVVAGAILMLLAHLLPFIIVHVNKRGAFLRTS
jgi:hypothetical protein